MDKEEIKALISEVIKPMLGTLQTAVTEYVDTRIQSAATSEETDNSLEAQVSELREQLAQSQREKDEEKENNRRIKVETELLKLGGDSKVLSNSIFKDVLMARYGNKVVIENDGKFYVKDGTTSTLLTDVVSSFLRSDEGKALLPSTGTDGSGSIEGTKVNPSNPMTSEQALWSVYSNVLNK